jgi:hypothetical protein
VVFGNAVELEYYREGLRCDLWCLVLQWDLILEGGSEM